MRQSCAKSCTCKLWRPVNEHSEDTILVLLIFCFYKNPFTFRFDFERITSFFLISIQNYWLKERQMLRRNVNDSHINFIFNKFSKFLAEFRNFLLISFPHIGIYRRLLIINALNFNWFVFFLLKCRWKHLFRSCSLLFLFSGQILRNCRAQICFRLVWFWYFYFCDFVPAIEHGEELCLRVWFFHNFSHAKSGTTNRDIRTGCVCEVSY